MLVNWSDQLVDRWNPTGISAAERAGARPAVARRGNLFLTNSLTDDGGIAYKPHKQSPCHGVEDVA